ncbi:hypothetical protein [Mannheimia pernigra]|uniref:hypothetical protein n=1 Tax=Mannheimia pernigra TaxID=111844 RepID=UPI00159F4586|nr:hypothetical protein [Mannheimia pernigra]QLB45121.1 hypothetical protein HV561_10475 [Mannheimia pernigra]
MNDKFEIMVDLSKDYMRISREISYLIQEYKRDINEKIESIRFNKKDAESVILELFKVQEELSILKYKFNYEFDDFLDKFIYEFDRQDVESINYLINKISSNDEFISLCNSNS